MTITLDQLHPRHDVDNGVFDLFARAVQRRFAATACDTAPLFTTDAPDLYEIYLANLPASERQHHTCNCCRQFIQRFGNLVIIDDGGTAYSALWEEGPVPDIYRNSVEAMARAVRRAKVDGVFLTDEKVWGTPVTGAWHHFSVRPPAARLHRDRLMTPYQAMALKKQDFGTLSHGLADFSADTIKQALALLEADALYRAEKVIGPAQFLLRLHAAIDTVSGSAKRKNLIWKAVATAPVGFATPRSAMVGTLLEDIAAGKSLDNVRRSFAAKMHPLQYQRPQAPARAGNIEQAEKIVEKLGIANSLKRRFARIEDVRLIWSPTPKAERAAAGGVFGHLQSPAKRVDHVHIPSQVITWAKFAATVLPKAEKIQVKLARVANLCGVITAVDMDAPPILQWDSEDDRNPVAWYVYHNGSSPVQWGLPVSQWIEVPGVMLKPSMWAGEDRFTNHGKGSIFILAGARDTRNPSLALFPECLKSELHSIRSTIEAYSRAGTPEGSDEASANGLMISEKGSDAVIRVTTSIGTVDYKIDRWD